MDTHRQKMPVLSVSLGFVEWLFKCESRWKCDKQQLGWKRAKRSKISKIKRANCNLATVSLVV